MVILQKNTKNEPKITKKGENRLRIWSFRWRIKNRPTYSDFKIYVPDPQLHQIFKPIRNFFCTLPLLF